MKDLMFKHGFALLAGLAALLLLAGFLAGGDGYLGVDAWPGFYAAFALVSALLLLLLSLPLASLIMRETRDDD
jgi:hypothetical protein